MIDKKVAHIYTQEVVDAANLDNNDMLRSSIRNEGGAIMDREISLYQYISLWLQLFKKNEVKQGTYDRLVQSNESLSRYPISQEKVYEVTPLDIQFYINQIKDENYSFSTIKKQLELLRAALRKAVKLKLISDNPAEDVEMPNQKMIKKPKEILAYTEQEQEQLHKYIEEHSDNNAILCTAFMIETGLRSGEALALRWRDINLEKHRCNVYATIVNPHIPSKAYVQDTPKTDSSIRTVPLNTRATTILGIMKHRSTSEYIFGDESSKSKRLEYPTLIRAIKKNVPEYKCSVSWRTCFSSYVCYQLLL